MSNENEVRPGMVFRTTGKGMGHKVGRKVVAFAIKQNGDWQCIGSDCPDGKTCYGHSLNNPSLYTVDAPPVTDPAIVAAIVDKLREQVKAHAYSSDTAGKEVARALQVAARKVMPGTVTMTPVVGHAETLADSMPQGTTKPHACRLSLQGAACIVCLPPAPPAPWLSSVDDDHWIPDAQGGRRR
jgi:hypothetical protein